MPEPVMMPERRELRRRLELLAYQPWLARLLQDTLDWVDEIASTRPMLIAAIPELLPLLPPQLTAGRSRPGQQQQPDQREFAIQYPDGGMREWSCSCTVIFDSIESAALECLAIQADGRRYGDENNAGAKVVMRDLPDWRDAR